MNHIAIDAGDFVPGEIPSSGIKRIISYLLHNPALLSKKGSIYNYYFFSKKSLISYPLTDAVRYKRLLSSFFSSVFLPLSVIIDKNDSFLGVSGNIPPLLAYFPVKKILFLYDLGFLKFPHLYSDARKMQRRTEESLKIADKVVVFSEYGKKELIKYFPLFSKDKIEVIPLGKTLLTKTKKMNYGSNPNTRVRTFYFLYVGILKPIKDIERLLRIFFEFIKDKKFSKYKLILVGSKEKKYFDYLIKTELYRKISDRLVFLENTDEKKLLELYAGATAVLNVSLEEGLCFPVLESLSYRTPAIVNNLEIYDEYKKFSKLLFVGKNDKDIIDLMKRTASS